MSTKVYTYGTRGMIEEWSTLRKYHSCTVVSVEGVKICIDCGSPALFRHVLDADAFVNSHSHPDHLLGLVDKKVEVPTFMGEFSTHMDPVPSYFKKIEFKNLKVVKRRVKVKGLTIEFVPVHHSVRCPMCAIYFPDLRLMVATDIVAPVGGWSQWKRKIRFYVGDCSSPAAPIIRRRGGKIFGHASVVSQIKALGDKHYLFTHHGRQTIELKEREVIKRIGAPIKVAKDGDVFDLDDERGFVRR